MLVCATASLNVSWCVCVCPDGVGLTCQAYPGGPLLGSDSTGECTPARPAARTSTAADSAPSLLHKKCLEFSFFVGN